MDVQELINLLESEAKPGDEVVVIMGSTDDAYEVVGVEKDVDTANEIWINLGRRLD